MPIRVFLVEDHQIFRLGLKQVLGGTEGIEVVGEATDLRSAIDQLQQTGVDIIVLDLDLPDAGGIDLLKRIQAEAPDAAILVVSANDGGEWAERVVAAGGQGYVDKGAEFQEIVVAIRAIQAGRCFISVAGGGDILRRDAPVSRDHAKASHDALSNREVEVLSRIARGLTNQQAADELFLSVKTVETYRSRLTRKLGFSSRSDLFEYARKTGLVAP